MNQELNKTIPYTFTITIDVDKGGKKTEPIQVIQKINPIVYNKAIADGVFIDKAIIGQMVHDAVVKYENEYNKLVEDNPQTIIKLNKDEI